MCWCRIPRYKRAVPSRITLSLIQVAKYSATVIRFVHLAPQTEHLFADNDTVTLTVAQETAQFTVTGTVLLGGQHAGCHVQVAGDGWE